ncbi:MAG: hypothetical protein ABIQ70_01430 [Dokdonella sp.]
MSPRLVRCFAAVTLFAAAFAAHADYRIDWHVIANGGGDSIHGTTEVSGTLAQIATATSCSSDAACGAAAWEVTGGYWTAVPCDATADAVFCNGFDD